MTRILVVEDDEYKASDIIKTAQSVLNGVAIERAASVTSALTMIHDHTFDLVILDMSLPTFDISGPGGGGSPEGQGGIEVLRLARRVKNQSKFVVVTQYPDIEVEGREVSLSLAAAKLSQTFKLQVLGCLLYDFDDDEWRVPLIATIREIVH